MPESVPQVSGAQYNSVSDGLFSLDGKGAGNRRLGLIFHDPIAVEASVRNHLGHALFNFRKIWEYANVHKCYD